MWWTVPWGNYHKEASAVALALKMCNKLKALQASVENAFVRWNPHAPMSAKWRMSFTARLQGFCLSCSSSIYRSGNADP